MSDASLTIGWRIIRCHILGTSKRCAVCRRVVSFLHIIPIARTLGCFGVPHIPNWKSLVWRSCVSSPKLAIWNSYPYTRTCRSITAFNPRSETSSRCCLGSPEAFGVETWLFSMGQYIHHKPVTLHHRARFLYKTWTWLLENPGLRSYSISRPQTQFFIRRILLSMRKSHSHNDERRTFREIVKGHFKLLSNG